MNARLFCLSMDRVEAQPVQFLKESPPHEVGFFELTVLSEDLQVIGNAPQEINSFVLFVFGLVEST